MSNTLQAARLHEHAGRIAIHFENMPTIYITPKLAIALGNALAIAGQNVKDGYHYSTTEIAG